VTPKIMRLILVAGLVAAMAAPAAADRFVIQPFEDPTWDEDPAVSLTEAIEALREVHPYLFDVRGLDMTRTRRTRGFVGNGLEVVIPPGGYRGFGPYARLPKPVDDAWFRYYIRLLDFRPVSSGKLPGLADASVTVNAKGCKPSTEADPGWSARLMFDTIGTGVAGPGEVPIGVYVYHLGQAGECGDEMMFDAALSQDRWTCIEGRVRMNSLGKSDGLVRAWIDGEMVFARNGLAFRRPSESGVAVREMWDNVYFGGSYSTPNALSLVLDDMVVSDSGRVGCIDPFADDNDSIHEGSLTELHARGLLFGCGVRQACPKDTLTRGEFAAMLQRVLSAPTGRDAFVDDTGHFAEGAFNALAAANIIRGCDPPANTRVCPDAPVTRAEVAALVGRALHLPAGPEAFDDDDGHWAEADINALAASGITRGCDEAGYCPDRTMFRMEAATFIVRVDDIVRALEPVAALPDWPPPGPPPPIPPDERE
jgi:hypothetical protein